VRMRRSFPLMAQYRNNESMGKTQTIKKTQEEDDSGIIRKY
jgi:hypothetical protein